MTKKRILLNSFTVRVFRFTLEQVLHHRSDRILFFRCLLATAFRWLHMIEEELYSGKHLFLRTSQLMARFIRDTLLEVNIDIRRALLDILRSFLIRLKLFSVRHCKPLVELIDDTIDNYLLRADGLKLLVVFIRVIHPRLNTHRHDIMKILVRSTMKITDESKTTDDLRPLVVQCLQQLHAYTTNDYVRDALDSLIRTSQLDVSYRNNLQMCLDALEHLPTNEK
jgi:hypothetical protein